MLKVLISLDQIIRIFLIVTEILLVLLAVTLLIRRRLPLFDSFAWLLLCIFIPIFGPFFTIAFVPRNQNRSHSVRDQSKKSHESFPYKHQ